MKSTKSLIALSVLSVVMGSSAFAGNVTRANIDSDLQAYQQSGLANLERGDISVDANSAEYKLAQQRYDALTGHKVQQHALSRAEVKADLQAYQQSGLANFGRGNVNVDVNSIAYQNAEQRYEALRGEKIQHKTVTRAAVKADLQAYQASGLADLTAGNRDVDEFSVQYQNALNKYNQLRSQM